MKKANFLTFIFAGAIFVGIGGVAHGKDAKNVGGHYVLKNGETYNFIGIHKNCCRYIKFEYGSQDKTTKVLLSQVQKITFGEDGDSAVIRLRDGRVVKGRPWAYDGGPVYSNDGVYEHFYSSYFDSVKGTTKHRRHKYKDIAEIVVGEHAGHFRKCPNDKKMWPSTYVFCPRCGTRTEWASNPSGIAKVQKNKAWACPECGFLTHQEIEGCPRCETPMKKAKTDTSRKPFEYFLGRAGVEPGSEEAELAKEYAKDVFNPFSNEKEIVSAIKEAVTKQGDK